MTKEKFMSIVDGHSVYCTIVTGQDIWNALSFVSDLLHAEAMHIKETEPYAVNTIERLEQAAHTVSYELDIDELVEQFEEENDR